MCSCAEFFQSINVNDSFAHEPNFSVCESSWIALRRDIAFAWDLIRVPVGSADVNGFKGKSFSLRAKLCQLLLIKLFLYSAVVCGQCTDGALRIVDHSQKVWERDHRV